MNTSDKFDQFSLGFHETRNSPVVETQCTYFVVNIVGLDFGTYLHIKYRQISMSAHHFNKILPHPHPHGSCLVHAD